MRKQYLLITLLLCSLFGIIYSKSGSSHKSYFPDCRLTVNVSSTGKDTICLGSSVDLAATPSNGTNPYTYSWLPVAGLSNSTISNPVATPTVSTNYTVTVTDHNGCTASASIDITVNQPPVVNADTLLSQYLLNEPLTATGGVPPYTYNFSPALSTSSLVTMLTSTVTTTYTVTVTGANGCSNVYNASYIPIPGIQAGACKAIFMSEYIQDTLHNDDGIELYNPTPNPINLTSYYLAGTTNGSLYATPFFIALHGTIAAHSTFLIANTHADTGLTNHAGMLSDSLTFGGKDIVALLHIQIAMSGLQCTALDMVGAISPLPTDSGWAVGSGSTKNHTLVRQASVTQGDMDWTTCATEWNVYPRGTFNFIGHYQNICKPTDPDIDLYLSNPTTVCGEPSYVNFVIRAASSPPTVFNNCIIDLSYSGGEFTGDSLSNGGVIVTRGTDFQPDSGNDYDVFDSAQVADTVIKITLGSVADSSPNGTTLTPYSNTLFLVSLRVQNSCKTGIIQFTDLFNTDTAYYVNKDSTSYLYHDTIATLICGDCALPCDSCGYDSTCGCYTAYCCSDSFSYRYVDTTLYHYIYPNSHYTTIIYTGDVTTTDICGMQVDPVPPVNAGTNDKSVPANSSTFTITGYGFGNRKGRIQVHDANSYLTNIFLDSTDILSWTENKIVVRMPSYLINADTATPGTGLADLFVECGNYYFNLQINYNIENAYHPSTNEKTRSNIVMSTDSNSFVFHCDTSVSNNPQALACVKKAIREWNCYTGVNWKLGSNIMLDTTLADGISDIYFANNNNFPTSAALMVTTQQFSAGGACYDYTDSISFYDEADIKIRLDTDLPGHLHWSYDTTYTVHSGSYFYFYDNMLHELGHALGLGHINDPSSLMYWYRSSGRRDSIPECSYYPGPATLYGAFDMINTSLDNAPGSLPDHCPDSILVTDTRGCIDHTLSVPDIPQNPYSLNLYPNPINYGNITITYDLTQNSQIQFKIFDCTGRVIMNLNNENKPPGTYTEQINVDNLAEGVYLFIANINGECQTIKFIKL